MKQPVPEPENTAPGTALVSVQTGRCLDCHSDGGTYESWRQAG